MAGALTMIAIFGVTFLLVGARSQLRKRADEDRRRRGVDPWGDT